MMLRLFLLFPLFLLSVVADELILYSPRVVHFSSTTPGTIIINGAKYRESSTSQINSQMVMFMNPGKYTHSHVENSIVSYSLYNPPLFTESTLNNIQVLPYSEKVVDSHLLIVPQTSMVHIMVSLELILKPSCNIKDRKAISSIDALNSQNYPTVSLRINNNIISEETSSMFGLYNRVLANGIYQISLVVKNPTGNIYGNYPTIGSGFIIGRQLASWYSIYNQNNTQSTAVKNPLSITVPIFIPSSV